MIENDMAAEERSLNIFTRKLTRKNERRRVPSASSLWRWLVLAGLCAGCAPGAPTITPEAPSEARVQAPAEPWRPIASGERAWRINKQQSLIAVQVYRGGALARLGHDHVVASGDIDGEARQQDGGPGQADLHFRLDQMSVDEPALRKQAGLDTQPGADAINGTRNNMLTRVLDAERFPLVAIHARWIAIEQTGMTEIALAITLHGVTRTITTPARIARNGDAISVQGSVRLNQSDFGIVPFSVMGGAMAVKDGLDVRFYIVAEPG
jgi:polyisoprenoid-binding protein YceI